MNTNSKGHKIVFYCHFFLFLVHLAYSKTVVSQDVSYQVSLGTQTETDRLQEGLQDTVTAYEMQNKFLNKEVLELNQLRQQAIDREQKLFLESSDWEAKFYQIQSKYLLLLNELHNPQVRINNIVKNWNEMSEFSCSPPPR